MKYESKDTMLDKAYQYLHWLTTPNPAFSNMAVCPFIEPEIKKEQLYIDIWYPPKHSFMDMMSNYYDSQRRSALFICQDSPDIQWSEVERKPIQATMINIGSRPHFHTSHKQLQKSSYFANFNDDEKSNLKVS